jgi:hypothetical protein
MDVNWLIQKHQDRIQQRSFCEYDNKLKGSIKKGSIYSPDGLLSTHRGDYGVG